MKKFADQAQKYFVGTLRICPSRPLSPCPAYDLGLFAAKLDSYFPLLVNVSLGQVDRVLHSLSVFVAVQNKLVSFKQIHKFIDHCLDSLNSVADCPLELKDQVVELVS
jgi:hypothetical protein